MHFPRSTPLLFVLALVAPKAHAELVDLADDVPEAAHYQLAYRLDLPLQAAFNRDGIPYAVDAAAQAGSFSRVAYHLQLETPAGDRSWIYVSMTAFTDAADRLGVPSTQTATTWQRAVTSLSVRSNVPGVVEGDDLDGWLEFWPFNYVPANRAGVPGATDEVYDTGDSPNPDGNYGSMQVHSVTTSQVLLAYNRWGLGDAPSDVGIGDCAQAGPNGLQPDWTFLANAGAWSLRRLDVYVEPGPLPPELVLTVEAPTPHAVYQRQAGNSALVPVRGHLATPAHTVEARVGPDGPWSVVATDFGGADFEGTLLASAGWHRVEIRATGDAGVVGTALIEPVGVGEVFITAGQSNSANHGQAPLTPMDPRVSARGLTGWQFGADPQPVATGTGGSPWSALGDLLAARFDVPIGFLSVGWGGTTLAQWQPGAADALYFRLSWALGVVGREGARAVLWHQGESDANQGTTAEVYAARLQTIIGQSRMDAGWDVPWIVARVGFLPANSLPNIEAVVQGQQAVIDADPLVFEGPGTDDLLGAEWRYDQVHFNEPGLREHARRWAERIEVPECAGFDDPVAEPVLCPDAALPPPHPDAAAPPEDAAVPPPAADAAIAPPLADASLSPAGDTEVAPSRSDSSVGPPPADDGVTPPGTDAGSSADGRAPEADARAEAVDSAAKLDAPNAAPDQMPTPGSPVAPDARALDAAAEAEPAQAISDCNCRVGRTAGGDGLWLGTLVAASAAMRRRRTRRPGSHRNAPSA